jgi:hypothetical protein
MASNNGSRLLVLGLSFRQHHTLHMQQVLRAYERLPANPMDRGALYTSLFELAKDLDEDETQNIENWLKNGGEFPAPPSRNPPQAEAVNSIADDDEHEDEEGEWPEYHSENFETGSSESNGDMNEDAENSEEESEEDDDPHARAVGTRRFAFPLEGEEGWEGDSEDENAQMDPRARRTHLKSKSSGEMIECLICADEFDKTEFPETTQITSNCNHKNDERVCIYCLQQSIATAVTEGQLHLVICPFCPEKLSHDEVKKYATREVFARYSLFPFLLFHG